MNTAPIPYFVLEKAIKDLKARASEKVDTEHFSVLYEELPLKDAHSQIPTLYKIKLMPDSIENITYFGVWTATGQKINLD